MRGEEWKREKGEEEGGRKRRRGLGREDRVRWEQERRGGEEMGGGCEGKGEGREDEEGRGGDVKRMGKRRKVRLWVCRGNGERRRERREERRE